MNIKFAYLLLLIPVFGGCSQHSETEKHYKGYDNVINVHDRLQPIEIKEVFFSDFANLYLMDKYLIISDYHSPDRHIHLFDKNSFKYICSTGNKGNGPGEITNLGDIATDESHGKFYVSDHGKLKIFSYDLDSLLADPLYLPSIKVCMDNSLFPSEYEYINDTLCFGRMIKPIGNNDFNPFVGKWNMLTNEFELMKYEHPDVKKKRFQFAVSTEEGIYVECYSRYDLMIICNLDGTLKCNVYGPKWSKEITNICHYNMEVHICKDKILALYSGADHRSEDYYPSKIHIFDTAGNYIKTLETGYHILSFQYDKEKHRIILCTNGEMQFGYLDLEGII